jgi:nickel/cobalt transporter (NicO) family protein
MLKKLLPPFIFLLAFTVLANAHPLGNFSVNNFSRLTVEKQNFRLHCVLDMAEIPTFQESQKIDTDKNGSTDQAELNAYLEQITPKYLSNLKLFLDNQPLELAVENKEISLVPGAANLMTLRVVWDLTADSMGIGEMVSRLRFENSNFNERVGWNEIVINRASGVNVFDSTAFGSPLTDELNTYPEEMLLTPLAERTAEFSVTTSAIPANATALQNRNGSASAPIQKDKFTELIAVPEITPTIALFGLLLAFGLGAMHALSPGHGKAVVGAYLVGSKGTPKHALFLGATVTITHTLGVFALGLITLFASNYILPEKMMPFLSFVSGLLVLYIGLTMFKSRLFNILGWEVAGHHPHEAEHSHENEHSHSHGAFTHTHDGHTHSHLPPEQVSWKSILALGISGGLLPCPSALVLMLSAINLERIGYGLILTVAFSFGLAATLTGIGLIFLYGGKLMGGSRLAESRLFKTLPVASAFLIACVGAVICYNSLV